MDKKEFVELYLKANEDTRKAIEKILIEAQLLSESPGLPADKGHIIE